jgi:site-specific DNA-cytosine methylase
VLPGQQELFDQPFVKSRRAQSTTDHETWVEGDVAPTLNAFDNATETRATVVVPTIIFENSFRDGIRINDDISHTLPAKMGTGGGNQPHVAQPLVYDGYNQDLDDSGVHRTLRIGRDSSDFVAQPVTVFQPGTMLRLGGGVWEDTVPTLRAEAKRGDNEPHIAQPIPIQDGREIEKHQNGLGIADEGSPAYTLDQTGAQSVAQPYSFDTQFGSNANVFTDLSPTLKATQASPSVAFSVREDAKANTFSATPTDVSLCLTGLVPSPQSHHAQLFIAHPLEYAVRRLTPLECERLMGWPDDHTRWTDDGREQADSHRYRQCGNGVATPVAAWIGSHLLPLLEP